MSACGRFFGVSLGPGDPELITVKALKILQSVDCLFTVVSRQSSRSVSGAIIDALDGVSAERTELVFAMRDNREDKAACIAENVSIIVEKLRNGLDCAFTTIGDALTYSTYGYVLDEIKRQLPGIEIVTVPGVNSWTLLSSQLNRVLVEDRETLSVIPSFAEDKLHSVVENVDGTAVLLKTYNTRDALIAELDENGYDYFYGSNLGMDDEFISSDADAIIARDKEYLSMLIVKKKK